MSDKLATLDQFVTIPGWEGIRPILEGQGLIIVGNDVYVLPDLNFALAQARESLEEGEFNREALYPIFDLRRVESDVKGFLERMNQILGYHSEVEPRVVGVTYKDLHRLFRGGREQRRLGPPFEEVAARVLGDVAQDFFIFVDDSESEDEEASDDSEDEEASDDSEDEEASDDSEDEEASDDSEDEEASDDSEDEEASDDSEDEEASDDSESEDDLVKPMTQLRLTNQPPMALPMQTDLGALNQARTGLAEIQEVNPEASFQRKPELPPAPLPVPPPTTLPKSIPVQLPSVQLPQVLPTAKPSAASLTVAIPRFTTKMDPVAPPVSGVAVAAARATPASAPFRYSRRP